MNRKNIVIPEESLGLVTREAGGSVRDALSLLDQVMTCSDGPVTHDQVLDILGVVDHHVIAELANALLAGDVARLLAVVDTVYGRGQNLKKVYVDLLTHIRNLVVIKLGDISAPLVDLPDSEIQRLKGQVRNFSAAALNQLFNLLYREETLVRLSAQPRLAVEMVLIQICQMKPTLPVDDLIESIDAFREALIESEGGLAGASEAAAAHHLTIPARPKPVSDAPSVQASGSIERATLSMPVDEDGRQAAWARIAESIAASLPALAANLQQASLVALNEQRIEIEVKGNEFSVNRVKRRDNIEAIRQAVAALFGQSPEVIVHGKTTDPTIKQKKKAQDDELKQQALSHPMVSEVVERFQGKVVEVKILSPGGKAGKT